MVVTIQSRRLEMRYAGGLVRHLGVQMYSGAVGSVAELIANAWDADATAVEVTIPFDKEWDANSEIVVRDNGTGMGFDECNDKFLLIGLDRRGKDGDFTAKNRKVLGRKGLGKLACFGTAKLIEVRTVKDHWLTHFSLDYDEIIRTSKGALVSDEPYAPHVLKDERSPGLDHGTSIILKRLQLKHRLREDEFRSHMARRFAILADDFRVIVNGKALVREEASFQFRYPEAGVSSCELPGLGTVKWWFGFTEKPIPDENARGIVVMARGKMAQAPFFFHLSGGVYGQHGMQYMTGEVHADSLDDHPDIDVIATDRASIRWEDPLAKPLLDWGTEKVKSLLFDWAGRRSQDKVKSLHLGDTPYIDRIKRFPERERKEIDKAVHQFASIAAITQERFYELVDLFLKAYENQQFMDMIRAINALDEVHQDEIFKLFAEWNVLEAVQTAAIVRGRVEIIHKFRQMIESGIREKPEMHSILKGNPWLIDPKWDMLEHERALDTIVIKHFEERVPRSDRGRQRLDIFCLGDSARKVVVEVKRPGEVVGQKEIQQAMDYVFYLREWAGQSRDQTRHATIQGLLIVEKIRPEDRMWRDTAENTDVFVRTWSELLATAERLYDEFLHLVKSKVPADDPRIQAINRLPAAGTSPTSSASPTVGEIIGSS
jgi:hypothetical protein